MLQIILILFLSTITNINSQDVEVQYYMNLINDGVKKSFNYKLPTNNDAIYPENLEGQSTVFGSFDYIVIGGGSAGAIVAKRLSESKFNTLLIEAGKQETDFNDIPGVFKNVQFSEYNWGYYTKSQKNICQGMENAVCFYPRGKSLGGTGTLNGMAYARGNPSDHNSWSEFGISGWSWDEMLPYYKKFENYDQIGAEHADPKQHGFCGPVAIDYARPANFLVNVFLQANKEFYQVSKDYNGEVYMAAGKVQMNKRNGKRQTSNRCYLSDYNKYLTISIESYATKIVISNNRAIAVEFVKGNKRYRANSKFEVIVSGGNINTPQLLMLSGIGPAEELSKHQINLIKHLPVGKNFEEHVGFSAFQFESSYKAVDSAKPLTQHIWEYLSGTGRLTDTATQAVAFISTTNDSAKPDIEVMFNPQRAMFASGINEYNYKQDTKDTFAIPSEKLDYSFGLTLILLHPKSNGTVTLKSSNPKDFPIIDPNSLSAAEDVETLYRAISYVKNLMDTKTFKAYNVRMYERILSACKDYQYLSKEYWVCTMKHMSTVTYHGVGTCRMGTNENDSVVDNKLRVFGIKGLRIADLSVAPKSVSGHTNALAMAIGEKAADLIKRDYFFKEIWAQWQGAENRL